MRPFIIHYHTRSATTTFYFVGAHLPSKVAGEYCKFEKAQKIFASRTLDEFYGKRWSAWFSHMGGADTDVLDTDTIGTDTSGTDTIGTDTIDTPKATIDVSDIAPEDIEFSMFAEDNTEQTNEFKALLDSVPQKMAQKKMSSKKSGFRFIFSSIYDEYSVLTLKQKIFYELEIPIFAQHLWIKNPATQLSYSLVSSGKIISIDAANVLETKDAKMLEGVPINQEYMTYRGALTVDADDQFNIVRTTTDHVHMINLLDYLPLDAASAALLSDPYRAELIYWTFVGIYFPMLTFELMIEIYKDANSLKNYPDIYPDEKSLETMFEMENQMFKSYYELLGNTKLLTELNSKTSQYLTLSIFRYLDDSIFHQSLDKLNVRNIFDLVELTQQMPWCRCIIRDTRTTFLEKQYLGHKAIIGLETRMDNITFKLIYDKVQHMFFTVYANGTFQIRSIWNIDNKMTYGKCFSEVQKFVNPLIKKINSLKSCLIKNIPISTIEPHNIRLSKMNITILFSHPFTLKGFTSICDTLNKYQKSGYLELYNKDPTSVEYFIKRGIENVDTSRLTKQIELDNYYLYLTNASVKSKWMSIFENVYIAKFTHRFTDIKIELNNIKPTTLEFFYNHIINIMFMSMHDKADTIASTMRKSSKKVKTLKEIDPVLYDFGRDKKFIVYSRICQKSNQPVILNIEEINALRPGDKERVVG
jgi:hypothetical protein